MTTVSPGSFIVFTQDGTLFAVPGWAPARIVSLAAMKHGARIHGERPSGSTIWHPSLFS